MVLEKNVLYALHFARADFKCYGALIRLNLYLVVSTVSETCCF